MDFRLPLRGACSPYLTPTAKNVFNKFSVRYFVRLVLETFEVTRRVAKSRGDDDDDEDSTEELEESEVDSAIESNFHEVIFLR